MRSFKTFFSITALILAIVLGAGDLKARTIFSDAPFPWGTETPFNWESLNGVWRAESAQGATSPLLFKFRVVPRAGGVLLVSSQVSIENARNVISTGYGFVVVDQRSLNVAYFGDGIVPLAVIRDYPGANLYPSWARKDLTLTWVWDANNPNFVYQHMKMEKISNESDL